MSGYQFGPFDLDIEQSELRKGGVQIRIQKQPFLILRTLVEKAPLLVSREELRHSVWPSDTFVDFDHGLNAAVNKVRQALGDSTGRELYTLDQNFNPTLLKDIRAGDIDSLIGNITRPRKRSYGSRWESSG